ncbi:MAG: amino acid permease [Acidobacteria bacterium]|jgi:amino acid transporter/Trk K+ transport system NAD-binding subunit|nr:amino acid permease [Acidobacteriota bacterium]
MSAPSAPVPFKRNVGLFMAVMIGIGAMMGPGIFALPSEVAAIAGPLGILTYLAMGIVTLLTALNYAELGAAIPLAGGGYSFTSRTQPRAISFVTGWFFWIGNTLACAMYALIFALTVKDYIWPEANVAGIIAATALIFGALNLRGMSEALKAVTLMNLVELAILVGFTIFGAPAVRTANLQPFAPHGLVAFIPAMALIYVSYVGFELITVASEEIVDPGRTIPRAILVTLAVATVIYVAVVAVMMGTTPTGELAKTNVPFVFACGRLLGRWGTWAAIIATIMASLSAFAVTLGASARVLFALGRDGHLPDALTRLHRRFRTPHVALAVCTVVVIAAGSSGIVRFVASLADFGYLMGLGFVNLSVVALRRRMPSLRRPFEAGFYPWIPILGAISCWAIVPALEARSFLLGGAMTAAGTGLYVLKPANRREILELPARFGRWSREQVIRLRRETMRVVIIGGGPLGTNIAARLVAHDEYRLLFRTAEHQITFVEGDPERCAALERRFGAPIYQGDGTKIEVLQQVGADNVDVAIAAEEDDGRNVIAALQAHRVGIAKVIAVVQEPDYVPLLEEEGIVALSAPWATAAMVENVLDRPGIADLFEIGSGVATLVSVTLPSGAKAKGASIQELSLPQSCVIAAIIRGRSFVVPRGSTALDEGDEVVLVGTQGAVKEARDLLLGT